MIKTFANKETASIFAGYRVKDISTELASKARRKLAQIDIAEDISDLRNPPGNRLEKLSGNRDGQWSIRVNGQWRVCFEWRGGHAYEVEMVDYH